MTDRRLVSIKQLCVLLAIDGVPVHRCTVAGWLKDGTLARLGLVEANRVGRRRRFYEASVEQVLWRRRTGGLRRVG